jgi:hypothetical protein
MIDTSCLDLKYIEVNNNIWYFLTHISVTTCHHQEITVHGNQHVTTELCHTTTLICNPKQIGRCLLTATFPPLDTEA